MITAVEAKDKVYDAFWATVEANVEEQTGFRPEFDQFINTKLPEQALDLLILAVQAEMPCYLLVAVHRESGLGMDATAFDARPCEVRSDWDCPSCTARRKLAAMEVPA